VRVTKQLGRPATLATALYARARRALRLVNKVDLIKARHSGSDAKALLPHKRRDTSHLKPLDLWLVDGHTFKAKVRHPDHGAPFAPELTAVIDAATRKICGWSVSCRRT
jgi:putative transposase